MEKSPPSSFVGSSTQRSINIKYKNCEIFTSRNGSNYIACEAIDFHSNMHPLLLPRTRTLPIDQFNLTPKLEKIIIRIICHSRICTVKLCIEYEVKLADQVRLFYEN